MPKLGADGRPVAYVCYLCGAQYGSQSLHIHIDKCQVKWQQREDTKAPRERRALPPPPAELGDGQLPTAAADVVEFNARMFDYYNKVSLCQCQHCGRSFNEEAFARHQTMCTAETPGGPHAKTAPAAGFGTSPSRMNGAASAYPSAKPRAYVCYLCGQQYGSQSLGIHIPNCQDKFQQVQMQKPKAERRALPPAPPELDSPLPTTAAGIDEFNEVMFRVYNGVSLTQCKGCGRSCNSEAYDKHKLRCQGTVAPPPSHAPEASRPQAKTGAIAAKAPTSAARPAASAGENDGMSKAKAAVAAKAPTPAARPNAASAGEADGGQKWKRESETIRAAMKASREVARRLQNGESFADMPSIPSAPDPSLVLCPHCGRRYNETAAARHIPACANIVNKPAFLKRGTGGAGCGAPKLLKKVPERST